MASKIDNKIVANPNATFVVCPSCKKGSVMVGATMFPTAPVGNPVNGLNETVERAWQETRWSYAAGAYTAATMMCRKLLMHMAVDKTGAVEGKSFAHYVNVLIESGELPNSHKDPISKIRERGNAGAHDLSAVPEGEAKTTLSITEMCLRVLYEVETY